MRWPASHNRAVWLFEFPFTWYRKAAPYRLFWLGVPFCLYVWTLGGPFVCDDVHLVLKSERYLRGESDTLELYRFAKSKEAWQSMRDHGLFPWWTPAAGRFDYFRPVAEGSFYLDVRLFGRNPFAARLISFALFLVALECVHWLFKAASGDPVRAGAATFFFGLSQTLTLPVTWMCNRQDLLVIIGVSLSAGAYWSAFSRSDVRKIILCAAGFTFALLCKEVAVALVGVFALHQLFLLRRPGALRGRAVHLWMLVLVFLATGCYLAYYLYSRPWNLAIGVDRSPSPRIEYLPLILLLYASIWTIGFPIDLLHMATKGQVFVVAALGGAVLLFALRYLRKSIRGDRAAFFFVLWAIFFALPVLRVPFASARLLSVATVAWAYLLVGLTIRSRSGQAIAPLWFRGWINAANGVISVGCVIGMVFILNRSEWDARDRIERVIASLPTPPREGDSLIVDRAESSYEYIWGGDRLEFVTGLRNVSLKFLLPPVFEGALLVVDEKTLKAQAERAGHLGSTLSRLTLGPSWQPVVERRFDLRDFTAEITEAGPDGAVRAVQFRFRQPLSTAQLHFYPPELFASVQAHTARRVTGTDRK